MPTQQTGAQTVDVNRRSELLDRYREIRGFSESLQEPLSAEDCAIQSMPDVSPTKWHLAHTTWFFETFIATEAVSGYRVFDEDYGYLFNSYYNAIGERHPRPERGLLSRPPLADVLAYRRHVDAAVVRWLDEASVDDVEKYATTIEIGLHHEQQHQELLLTDVKHVFSKNPLKPAYRELDHQPSSGALPIEWQSFDETLTWIGCDGSCFAFDNESPRHQQFLAPYELANRLVTNAELLQFVEEGGYQRPEFWLSDGWYSVQNHHWKAPIYWIKHDGGWSEFTLGGVRPLDPRQPVCHLSYFEADAYARWAEARLPTEAEWEHAALQQIEWQPGAVDGNFVESGLLHPRAANADDQSIGPAQLFGDVWEWTSSSYSPYPGYKPAAGALGEYNGKFMCNQYVLRGGSCATSRTHIRPTYRNFFPAHSRWQFTGLRLAR